MNPTTGSSRVVLLVEHLNVGPTLLQKCCLVLVLEWKVAIQWCGCWWGWIKLKTESDSLHHSGLTFFLLYIVEF
jgi:hypothetical protein